MPFDAPNSAIGQPGQPGPATPGEAACATGSAAVPGDAVGGADRALERASGVEEELPGPGHSPWRLQLAMVTSALVHASLLAWAFAIYQVQPGNGGQVLEAIGVEIVAATALESQTSRPDTATPAEKDVAATAPGEQSPFTRAEIAASAPKTALESPLPASTAPLRAEEEPIAEAQIAAAPVVAPEPERKREPTEKSLAQHPPSEIAEAEAGEADAHRPEQAAQSAGGAAATGTSDTEAGEPPAGASPGELARFSLQVRTSIGRTRPKLTTGRRGRVQIVFVLTEAGVLQSATVATSSGSPSLDEAALVAIRATAFPPPPLGATYAQREFIVPFEFK